MTELWETRCPIGRHDGRVLVHDGIEDRIAEALVQKGQRVLRLLEGAGKHEMPYYDATRHAHVFPNFVEFRTADGCQHLVDGIERDTWIVRSLGIASG